MAGNVDKLKQIRDNLNNILECGICKQTFDDPRSLVCIHSFCYKCLHGWLAESRSDTDTMRCPLCQRECAIPESGAEGFPKNFFLKSLTETMRVVNSDSADCICDPCHESDPSEANPTSADTYCKDCKEKLCVECGAYHKKKKHNLIKVGDRSNSGNGSTPSDAEVVARSVTTYCEFHKKHPTDLYCVECCEVLCPMCFMDKHHGHRSKLVSEVSGEVRDQLQESVENLTKVRDTFQKHDENLKDANESILQRTTELETEITAAYEEVKKLADQCFCTLLNEVRLTKYHDQKEVASLLEVCSFNMVCIENYLSFCQRLFSEGSDVDVCRAGRWLKTRSIELQQTEAPKAASLLMLRKSFRKVELPEENNLQQRMQFIGSLYEMVDFEELNSSSELSAAKSPRLAFGTSSSGSQLQKSDKSLEETDVVHTYENSCSIPTAEEFVCCRDNESSVESDGASSLGSSPVRSLAELASSSPVYLQTLSINQAATTEVCREIQGVTVLSSCLFVASDKSSKIQVYDIKSFDFQREFQVPFLVDPGDIVACERHSCIYIVDWKNEECANVVSKVRPNGEVVKKWTTPNDYSWLSVTREGNLVVTLLKTNMIHEYRPDGSLELALRIHPSTGIDHMWHSIKVNLGDYVICHGRKHQSRVCRVDRNGNVVASFGEGTDPEGLKSPVYLAEDSSGSILVVDQVRKQVMTLSCTVQFQSVLLTRRHRLQSPRRVCIDESSGFLFIADELGKILIFALKLF